jgi:hypothetical protein
MLNVERWSENARRVSVANNNLIGGPTPVPGQAPGNVDLLFYDHEQRAVRP